MALEILGGRMMAPQFGQTIHQWGALIGTALTFMSVGYWLGGRIGSGGLRPFGKADPIPVLLATAAAWAAATPLVGRAVSALSDAALGPLAGAVLAAAVLLGVPVLALAAVSPLCVGRVARGEDASRASGLVSLLGSLGSIGGTFTAAFLAIPYLGLSASYACLAAFLALAAVAAGLRPVPAVLALLPLVPGFQAESMRASAWAEYFETPYNTVMVSDTPQATMLFTNTPRVVQTIRRKDGQPTGQYYEAMAAARALAPGPRALFLGVAGGSVVEAVTRAWPDTVAVGVEIDPGVTDVARRRFGLAIPVADADARRYVEESRESFDAVFVDLYSTGQMPAHVVTEEFFRSIARRVSPGGVVAMNVFGGGAPETVAGPLAATMRAVFPTVLEAEAGGGNRILVASSAPLSVEEARARLASAPAPSMEGAVALATTLRPATYRDRVLTDDRSDLEIRAAAAVAASR